MPLWLPACALFTKGLICGDKKRTRCWVGWAFVEGPRQHKERITERRGEERQVISDLRGEGQMNIVLFDSWCYFKLCPHQPPNATPLSLPRRRFISSAPVSEFHFAVEIESCVRCPASPNVPRKRLIPSAAREEKGVKAAHHVKCNQGYCLSRQDHPSPPFPRRHCPQKTHRGNNAARCNC